MTAFHLLKKTRVNKSVNKFHRKFFRAVAGLLVAAPKVTAGTTREGRHFAVKRVVIVIY